MIQRGRRDKKRGSNGGLRLPGTAEGSQALGTLGTEDNGPRCDCGHGIRIKRRLALALRGSVQPNSSKGGRAVTKAAEGAAELHIAVWNMRHAEQQGVCHPRSCTIDHWESIVRTTRWPPAVIVCPFGLSHGQLVSWALFESKARCSVLWLITLTVGLSVLRKKCLAHT